MSKSGIVRVGVAGVVVSCKIPILATRVRFPGGATYLLVVLVCVIDCMPGFESSVGQSVLCSCHLQAGLIPCMFDRDTIEIDRIK